MLPPLLPCSLILETALQQTPPGGKMEVHVSRQRTLEGQVVLLEVLCRSTKGSSAKGLRVYLNCFSSGQKGGEGTRSAPHRCS